MDFKFRTLGGKQFWTDIHHAGGWRIQINAVTGQYRLIDTANIRQTHGGFDKCQTKLQMLIDSGAVPRTAGRIVIVSHGLIRTTNSMRRLGRYLEQHGDFTSVDFEYASTRCSIAQHAQALRQLIDSLGAEVTEINFVAHSLGNIVIRRLLGDLNRDNKTDPRFNRMVMIGPPNHGSKMARLLRLSLLYNVIAGSSGTQLGAGWGELEPTLATPDFEFGIIAGGQNKKQRLSNFMLPGQDDFTVSVEETRLEGARDFLVKPLFHGTMMRQQVTLEATLNFLEHGYFESAETQNPLPRNGRR